jgi:hypothetical protein
MARRSQGQIARRWRVRETSTPAFRGACPLGLCVVWFADMGTPPGFWPGGVCKVWLRGPATALICCWSADYRCRWKASSHNDTISLNPLRSTILPCVLQDVTSPWVSGSVGVCMGFQALLAPGRRVRAAQPSEFLRPANVIRRRHTAELIMTSGHMPAQTGGTYAALPRMYQTSASPYSLQVQRRRCERRRGMREATTRRLSGRHTPRRLTRIG